MAIIITQYTVVAFRTYPYFRNFPKIYEYNPTFDYIRQSFNYVIDTHISGFYPELLRFEKVKAIDCDLYFTYLSEF